MNAVFLAKNSDCLTFDDAENFLNVISSLDLSVPARKDGRKSYHRERVSAILYLKGLVHFSLIKFPFSICKSECPDFLLTLADNRIVGIEHRDITSEKWQKHLTEFARNHSNDPVFLDKFKIGGLPTIEANQGWVSNEIIDEWATLTLEALEDKLDLLNKGHYKKLDIYELLLNSNTHLPLESNDLDIAILRFSNLFNQKFASHNFSRLFDSLSIIFGNEIKIQAVKFNNAT